MKYPVTKQFFTNALCLMAIAFVSVAIGIKRLNEAPAFVHAWAQADRYALAVGFTENGHDLFHPETMVLNKQFPGRWRVDYGSGVTAVDLPLHEWVVGWLMTLLGTTVPWVFRGVTLLVSVVGLWFLFLLGRGLTGDALKGLLVALMALVSPVYAYYFANYLPSAPALALSMAGLWAYGRCYGRGVGDAASGEVGWWHLAIGFVALATMIRSSQAVLLVALCAFEGLRILRRETTLWNKLPSLLAAGVAMVGYMLWNNHLRGEYGSVFLNGLMPPRHWEDVNNVFDEMHWHWRFEYFSRLQYWVVAVTCVAAVFFLILKAKCRKQKTRNGLSLGWLATIWWVGEVCFFVAMLRQYKNHDYYFLDSFFLPVLFTFILVLRSLPSIKTENRKLATGCRLGGLVALVVLGGVMYKEARQKVDDRCWEGDGAYITSQRFAGADRWLDEQEVPRDAKILAFLAYPQNGPLLQMGRKGYTVMQYDEEVVEAALRFPYDYVVMEDERKVEAAEVIGHWELVADNGTLSLFKRKTESGES